jgi:hypothetical protein
MDKQTYSLELTGNLMDGRKLSEVKGRVATLFKLSESEVDKLFIGGPVVVKKGIELIKARNFQNTFESAGAENRIVPEKLAKVAAPQSRKPVPRIQNRKQGLIKGVNIKWLENTGDKIIMISETIMMISWCALIYSIGIIFVVCALVFIIFLIIALIFVVLKIFHWLGWSYRTAQDLLTLIIEFLIKYNIRIDIYAVIKFFVTAYEFAYKAILFEIILLLIGIVFYIFGNICNFAYMKMGRN